MATVKTRADLKNEAASRAQALSIVKAAAVSKSKVVSDAAKKVLAAIDAGTLSDNAVLSLSSGAWDEDIDFHAGKWSRFRHYAGAVEHATARNEAESPAFNSLISALTAQFAADGLKSVSVLMHKITSHLATVALHSNDEASVLHSFNFNAPGWEKSAKAEQKSRQQRAEHAIGAKEVDALLNPRAKKAAAKKAPAKKAKTSNMGDI